MGIAESRCGWQFASFVALKYFKEISFPSSQTQLYDMQIVELLVSKFKVLCSF